jgi:hypothetical protein
MSSEGSYTRLAPRDGEPPVNSQTWFLKHKASAPNP